MSRIDILSLTLLAGAIAMPTRAATKASASLKPAAAGSFAQQMERIIKDKNEKEKGNGTRRLHQLFKSSWDYTMRENPEWATQVGYPGQDGRWTDWSPAAVERRKKEAGEPLKALASIPRAGLSPADRLNYDLFKRQTEETVEGNRYPEEYLQVNQLGGIQQGVASTLTDMPARSVADYENILARLNGVPELVAQTTALLEKGLAAGVTPPRITVRDLPGQVESLLIDDPEKSPFLTHFKEFPAEISPAEQARLKAAAVTALKENVVPAFRKFYLFINNTYVPACREAIAVSALPDGAAWYAYRSRLMTTTRMSPEEIHALGLKQVEMIHAEMEKVMRETGFKGSFAEFIEDLRTKRKYFFHDRESLLTAYRDIAKRADPELAHLFGKLPRLPYGVIPVPSYSEKSQTTAYYMGGSPEAGRAGNFYANLYAPETRPKWEMEPLTLHEAVPGHHLQISLAQEQGELPDFRKQGGYTAYVEGWGLYSETLGYEMGFYKDPYNHFGALTYQMWRAVRLVVDTGIHAMGWTRQQAIDYFKKNSAKPEHDIIVEIDRYIVWPGQALAYKIGQLKIQELRDRAKSQLGDSFDIRSFHDALLENGALPLDVLEAHMDEWIAGQKQKGGKKN